MKYYLFDFPYISSQLHIEDLLKKRNIEFRALEEQLRQYEEKVKKLLFFSIISCILKHTLDSNV
jgi:hypothetical protein